MILQIITYNQQAEQRTIEIHYDMIEHTAGSGLTQIKYLSPHIYKVIYIVPSLTATEELSRNLLPIMIRDKRPELDMLFDAVMNHENCYVD